MNGCGFVQSLDSGCMCNDYFLPANVMLRGPDLGLLEKLASFFLNCLSSTNLAYGSNAISRRNVK